MKTTRLLMLALAAIAMLVILAPTRQPAAAQESTPVFEATDCRFTVPVEATVVECGDVIVPLDRGVADSGTIRLHVAVFRAETSTPAPDPVIYLDGGPGGKTLDSSEFNYSGLIAPHLAYRDVIVFDQRGIGFSGPDLSCPEVSAFDLATYEDTRDLDVIGAEYLELLAACRASLSESVDLNAINTTENAADVNDIITALNYDTYNIYGISYGTMLAQYVMRDHPEKVRSAVIDSNVPLTIDLYEEIPANFERSLRVLIDACAADEGCNALYPDLGAVIDAVVAQYNENPVTAPITNPLDGETYDAYITGSTILGVTFSSLYSESLYPSLPRTFYALQAGDVSLFADVLLSTQITNTPFSTPAMYNATMCNDEIGFNSIDELSAGVATTRPVLQDFYAEDLSFFDVCAVFDDGTPAPDIDNVLVESDIPTLVVSGEFDPITPPAWGDIVAEGLPNSYVYVYSNGGHGATTSSECATNMMLDFINDPSVAPDDSCMAELEVVFNLPLDPNNIVLEEITFEDGFGTMVTMQVPQGWEAVGSGAVAPPTDPTTAFSVVFAPFPDVDTTRDLLADSFSFDTRLDDAELGGRTWQVYLSELQGFTALIGLAEADGNVFVVFFISDDAETLRASVFEPALASIRRAE